MLDSTMFNTPQLEAIRYQDGPSLVVAGAGSGKTRVLTYKIAYLIEQGFRPWTILALTFTNKAANEMKSRIAGVVGAEEAKRLWMGTFHSMFLRILRTELPLLEESDPLHFPPNFTIYDQTDSNSLVKGIIRELGLDDKIYRPGSVLSRISDAKNHLVTAGEYAASAAQYQSDLRSRMPEVRTVYSRYQERLHKACALDFDDILVFTYKLFNSHPAILRKYQDRFQYILVDEYQDTNHAQHQIILQLAALPPHRVCVVGDDAQSIYSFRGADISNILGFSDAYPDCSVKLFKLEQNYRSTQTIVKAANSLIHKNQGQIHKEVFSERSVGLKIPVMEAYSDVEEAQMINKVITRLHGKEHIPYSDIAILYRTNAQSRVLEETMRKNSVPYCVYGGLSFYQHKEIKVVIAYFRLAVNPADEEALKRIINVPTRGIGQTTLNKIIGAATEHGVSLWAVLTDPTAYGMKLNSGTIGRLSAFADMVSRFIDKCNTDDAELAGRYILSESGLLKDIFSDTSIEGRSRQENIDELVAGLHDFVGLRREEGTDAVMMTDYLSEVALLSDMDRDGDDSTERVTLMTIHSAKGLEFDTVFVTGLEENLFPNQMSLSSPNEIEEERRLFYVAITRAKQHLYISYARSRYHFGKMEFSNPSRFIHDIDAQFLSMGKQQSASAAQPRPSFFGSRSSFSENHASFSDNRQQLSSEVSTRRLRPLTSVEKQSSDRFNRRTDISNTIQNNNSQSSANRTGVAFATGSIQVGQHILHDRFGMGEVVAIEGTGDGEKATVRFENSGVRQLLLKFARFKVVD
ncbi:MAG: UvrD-helicase domain-containing protein [Bacteroidaceae bacterium]|nr:UvrD-helicase domain-containing protein [Bacteroidaceae bacterium]